MAPQQRNHIICTHPDRRKLRQDAAHRVLGRGDLALGCGDAAVLAADEGAHAGAKRAHGDGDGGGELDHVCGADVVLGGFGGEERAGGGQAGVFGARAFGPEDEGAVAAVVDAVMEGGADGAAGGRAAALEGAA